MNSFSGELAVAFMLVDLGPRLLLQAFLVADCSLIPVANVRRTLRIVERRWSRMVWVSDWKTNIIVI